MFECGRRISVASEKVVTGSQIRVALVGRAPFDPLRKDTNSFVISAELLVHSTEIVVALQVVGQELDNLLVRARGIGIAPLPMSQPAAGMPSRRLPPGARPGPAWVPWIEPQDLTEAEAGIYPHSRPPANIHKAMSLVPAEVKSFFDLCEHHYLGPLEMRDFGREYRAITHAQIELLAARVSALNRCFY